MSRKPSLIWGFIGSVLLVILVSKNENLHLNDSICCKLFYERLSSVKTEMRVRQRLVVCIFLAFQVNTLILATVSRKAMTLLRNQKEE